MKLSRRIDLLLNPKLIAKAVGAGLVLTVLFALIPYKGHATLNNHCTGVCPAWVVAEVDATNYGLPLPIFQRFEAMADGKESQFSPTGLVVDWLLFSVVAYIALGVVGRVRRNKS